MLHGQQKNRIMNKLASCHRALPAALLLVLLVCGHGRTLAAELGGPSISASGSFGGSGGSGLSGQASAGASLGSGSGSSGAQARMSGGLSGGGGISGSAQAHISGSGPAGGSIISGSENSGGAAGSAGGSASLGSVASPGSAQSYVLSTSPKPEGLFSKMKDMVKSGVDNLVKDDKKEQRQERKSQQLSGTASLTAGASLGSGETASNQKPESGLMDKLGEGLKKGKEVVKETAKEVKDDVRSLLKPSEGSGSSGASASGSVKLGGVEAHAKISASGPDHGSNPLSRLANKGQEMVHKIENKASAISERLLKPITTQDGMEVKSSASLKMEGGSGAGSSSGGNEGASASASANFRLGGGQRDPEKSSAVEMLDRAHEVRAPERSSSVEMLNRTHEVRAPEKSLAVEMLDRAHEVVRAPVEQVLKPIDKALGYNKDPLVKVLDQSEELLREPLGMVAKPVESVLSGAFKTTDEAKAELSEQERREVRLREERARKEGRSVLGQITDKTVELAEKPWEIILRPVDRALGLKKNPLIQLIDEIYELSKRPLDAVARPIESILRKMATGEQDYQVSVRFTNRDSDPKLVTRLADGALNIADRVITKPIELVMRPLGYDQKRKNPVLNAAHSLKNATKMGLELLTRPIDRIIKEIAEIGAIKDEAEREAEIERKRQEASRIVSALDKFHEAVQQPFEIVLKPVGQLMGYGRDGRKEPLLRAWDVGYQVIRTPIQVFSKPIEDHFLGERKRSQLSVKGEVKVGKYGGVQAKASVNGGGPGGSQASASAARGAQAERRKNYFIESIKRMEKFAARPFDKITSPIRRLILGEDTRSSTSKVQAQANLGPLKVGAKVQVNSGSGNSKPGQSDKIVQTIEKINNVVLRPIEVMTQPLSDMVSSNEGRVKGKVDVKVQSSAHGRGQDKQQASVKASASASSSGSQVSSSGPPKASSLIAGFGSGTPQTSMALTSSASGSVSGSTLGGSSSGMGSSSMSASAQAQMKN